MMYIKLLMFVFMASCAIKHHVQVGDIYNPPGKKLKPFKILLSETGVNVKQAGKLLSAVTKDNQRSSKIAETLAMFQMGPRTGNHVFNEKYADLVPELILKECPSGHVTGLLLVRESNKYPVVSGEIVKVSGYCIN